MCFIFSGPVNLVSLLTGNDNTQDGGSEIVATFTNRFSITIIKGASGLWCQPLPLMRRGTDREGGVRSLEIILLYRPYSLCLLLSIVYHPPPAAHMLTGGFYHKSGLKIYFIFVIDMKSIGAQAICPQY